MTHDPGDDRAWTAASAVSSALTMVLGGGLFAVYVHGSAVLGGFRWDRSDLDVLVLTRDPLSDVEVDALPARLASLDYPANGLELSVLTAVESAAPAFPAPHFQLHVATDGWDRQLKVVDGRGLTEDDHDWGLAARQVCDASGVQLLGVHLVTLHGTRQIAA